MMGMGGSNDGDSNDGDMGTRMRMGVTKGIGEGGGDAVGVMMGGERLWG